MAHDIREAAEAVCRAQALVCNMGAIEQIDSMLAAGAQANRIGVPVVLDPVAAGGAALRRESAARLLQSVRFAVIRGSASEIRSLAGEQDSGSGVDAGAADAVTRENLQESVHSIRALARRTGSVIVVSGKTDLVVDAGREALISNGCATMARITGSGCMLNALTGAFCAAVPKDPLRGRELHGRGGRGRRRAQAAPPHRQRDVPQRSDRCCVQYDRRTTDGGCKI